ncbi:MAG TPA: 23S rRNA (pseudouridine(1915)-N(3))-methyltransferase RlmH [Pyrinomonadaceae bacterium]|nr:23S rRNA (pseudouridine(1915)-N(3))-methyltransferase RlmH [Chloracidobacterium sp.]HRJ88871.1 23S rRNA (pseudouridine(1915)-N(3))-methyltransferase RlmH [Pyrinomonadaceae bacterium]HRK50361.1 23S rRNA (pseudouridine(1915)-N(3))-methyltransferase RlmH [Pyrinomonadaceae bacterium]
MKFSFIWVGKTRNENLRALQNDYLQRLSHFVKTSVTELKDGGSERPAEIEGKRILQTLNQKSLVVLLDVGGRTVTSHELAVEVKRWQDQGLKEVAFVIGGFDGVSPKVAERADIRLSLSILTFTHEMARVIILEQLYRAYSILNGLPYQK